VIQEEIKMVATVIERFCERRMTVPEPRQTERHRFMSLHEQLRWFHYDKRERRYLLRVFGMARVSL